MSGEKGIHGEARWGLEGADIRAGELKGSGMHRRGGLTGLHSTANGTPRSAPPSARPAPPLPSPSSTDASGGARSGPVAASAIRHAHA
jgi:hypothetical protein